jgi:hypothetical protein
MNQERQKKPPKMLLKRVFNENVIDMQKHPKSLSINTEVSTNIVV